MRVHISATWSILNITNTITTINYYEKISKISLVGAYKPSYSQFCLKFCWHGNKGRPRVIKGMKRENVTAASRQRKRKEKIIIHASVAACAVEWRQCYYDVTQAPLHYESLCAHTDKQTDGRTDRKSDRLISTNVHYVHLGEDNKQSDLRSYM